MNNLHLILGGPGCGKTTRLLSIVEQELARGVPADRIAFVAFTKAAANEAAQRAGAQFRLDAAKDLPWFRTIHSLAYQRLGVMRDEMMTARDWSAFGDLVNESISFVAEFNLTGPINDGSKNLGDIMLRVIDLAAVTKRDAEDIAYEQDLRLDIFRLRRFADAYAEFKTNMAKMDFSDLLRIYATEGKPLDIEVGIIDEGQDLTALQWEAVSRAFSRAKRVYVGGDDDQAIYKWAGADVERFLNLSCAPEVLPVSHRLPKYIWMKARAISDAISHRYTKQFGYRAETGGYVGRYNSVDSLRLGDYKGTWLLLARNNYMLRYYQELAEREGLNYQTRSGPAIDPTHAEAIGLWRTMSKRPEVAATAAQARLLFTLCDIPRQQLKEGSEYTSATLGNLPWNAPWHEAFTHIPDDRRRYYLNAATRGHLLSVPRIRIETIHGAKGAEADHVALMSDMSARTYEAFRKEPDTEHRVFYVGATRAKQSLHILAPQGLASYPL